MSKVSSRTTLKALGSFHPGLRFLFLFHKLNSKASASCQHQFFFTKVQLWSTHSNNFSFFSSLTFLLFCPRHSGHLEKFLYKNFPTFWRSRFFWFNILSRFLQKFVGIVFERCGSRLGHCASTRSIASDISFVRKLASSRKFFSPASSPPSWQKDVRSIVTSSSLGPGRQLESARLEFGQSGFSKARLLQLFAWMCECMIQRWQVT